MKACMNVQGDRIHLQIFYIKELREKYRKLSLL
jgi:hypothetical protein